MGNCGFVPVIHGADSAAVDRPDEFDTLEVAAAVAASLDRLGYETEIISLGLDLTVIDRIAQRRPRAIFNLVEALRGDGRLAAMAAYAFEHCRVAFTGASASALAIANSKIATKRALVRDGLPTPAWWTAGDDLPDDGLVIIKSVDEHASLGIDRASVVRAADACNEIAWRAGRYGGEFFAERFIDGREFNVAMLTTEAGLRVLPIQEIVFSARGNGPAIIDYAAKWDPSSASFRNTPRRFGLESREPALAVELREIALCCWKSLGLSGYARIDFRVDDAGHPFILEANANPCLASDAGFMAAAREENLDFDTVITSIVAAANGPERQAAVTRRNPAGAVGAARCSRVRVKCAELQWRDVIREADVVPLRALVSETDMFAPAEVDVALELVAERLENGAASGYEFLIAESGNRIIGFACFGRTPATVGTVDLYWIVVAADWQGRGIGHVLLERVERAAKSMGGVRLFVETSSQQKYVPTRRFYGRAGFQKVAELPNYYRSGDNNVVYTKSIC